MANVIVVDYDPAWRDAFERLRTRICPCICDVATSIEHVGSTSVPGLAAKPVIDMTIVVPTASAMARVIDRLATMGYQHRGDLGVPGREAFVSPQDTQDHHLYACISGNEGLRNHLAVRDYLRSNPTAAQAYGTLKKQLRHALPTTSLATLTGRRNSSWRSWLAQISRPTNSPASAR
jgi:GrpB-like predicted nucleotidyltransferase (UPF0157 family)